MLRKSTKFVYCQYLYTDSEAVQLLNWLVHIKNNGLSKEVRILFVYLRPTGVVNNPFWNARWDTKLSNQFTVTKFVI